MFPDVPADPPSPPVFADPGPDLRPPPAVRPRTPEEVQPLRDSFRLLSTALLSVEAPPELRANGRLAWLHSLLPISTAEEVEDALAFAVSALVDARKFELYLGLSSGVEHAAWVAILTAVKVAGVLVDDMRAEVEGGTDRRRSVGVPSSPPPPGDHQAVYTVKIQTTCRACAFALGGQAPLLGSIRCAFVTQPQGDSDAPLTIHANSGAIRSTDGTPYACPEHGRYFDLSVEPA